MSSMQRILTIRQCINLTASPGALRTEKNKTSNAE